MKFSELIREQLSVSLISDRGYGDSGEDKTYRCVHMLNSVVEVLKGGLRSVDYIYTLKNNLKEAKKADRDNDDCIKDIESIIKLQNETLKCLKELIKDNETLLKPLVKKYGYKHE
mgnify:CR=1 FL=1